MIIELKTRAPNGADDYQWDEDVILTSIAGPPRAAAGHVHKRRYETVQVFIKHWNNEAKAMFGLDSAGDAFEIWANGSRRQTATLTACDAWRDLQQ